MDTLSFYLVSITYKVVDEKPIVMLVGRTKEGEKVCVIDKNERPYFYVELKDEQKDQPFEKIKPLFSTIEIKGKGVNYQIVDVQEVIKLKKAKESKLYKIYTNIPAGVPPIQKEIFSWEITKRCYEYDIRFTDKYLIDKQLTPLTLIKAKGKFLQKQEGSEFAKDCRVFDAVEISQEDKEDTYEKPRILAVDIETYNPEGKTIDINRFPIIMLSLYGSPDKSGKPYQKVITWKEFPIKDKEFAKNVEVVEDEKALIERFGECVKEFDADMLCGYNSDRFDLVYIQKRARINKTSSKLGIEDTGIILRGTTNIISNIIGISHIDVFTFIRRVFRFSMKTPTFSLDAVSKELLGAQKVEVDINMMYDAWDKADERCETYAFYNLIDSKLTYDLLIYGYALLAEMTKIIGSSPFDVSRSSMSQMVERYILAKAAQENRLAPNRPSQKQLAGRRRGSFAGGFVFTPKPGIYENLAVFDFRSLYPTIIASHNISTDTVNCECCKPTEKEAYVAPTEEKIWYCKKKKGFLSTIMRNLIEHRKVIKKEIKKQGKTKELNARSMAVKYLCNSFYGYLGFSMSRWYSIESSRATTAWARHYIKSTMEKAKEAGFEIVYGDTDSVFLKRGDKSKEDALQFAKEVNKDLPEFMELEVEGFFTSGLFVQTKSGEGGAKKRYALIDEEDNIKIAGFETVRRNTSPIARDVQKEVIHILLKEKDEDKALKHVQTTIQDLKDHKVPLEKVTIFTKLTKKVEDYDAIGPHVAAAKLMIEKGDKVGAGSPIYYVVCNGTGRIRDKVKIPSDVKEEDYDPDYYINNQVLPAVERIFDALGHDKETLTKSKKQSSLGQFF